ncbi:MAG TPA: hypothetical protein VFB13_08835 [Reyranella sp.]|nr:hypothetical protein [Reyranella sp.]
MSDRDDASDLRERLARLESRLTYVRYGKAPPQKIDLLSWRAQTSAGATGGLMDTLRDEWIALGDIFRNWAARVEERFSR